MRLRQLRKSAGISMRELGQIVGVAESTISHYENGKREPSFETLLKLGEYFGVSVDYLLGKDDIKNRPLNDYVEEPIPLYQNIKKFRTQLGLSQDAFARLIGYTDRSSVAKIETGKVDLSQSKIKAIADVLGVTVSELMGDALPPLPELEPYRPKSQMPLLGRVAAGLPMYAAENIEGYIANDFADGETYYALRVMGTSMDAAGIDAGDIVVVRQQSSVEPHEVGVILVNGNDATIKYFRQQGHMAILTPRSHDPIHQVQLYDVRETSVRIIGRVVQIRKSI